MNLHATSLVTDDLPRMRSFYEQVLRVTPNGNPIYCEFDTPSGTLALIDARVHPARSEVTAASNRSVEITLTVADVDAEYERLRGVVKEWIQPPTERFYEWRTAILRDPDGNLVTLGTPAPWVMALQIRDWPGSRLSEVMRRQVDDMCWTVRKAVRGLSDEEYFRELAPGSWSIRRRGEASTSGAAGAGEWVTDWASPAPDPPPFTTIAWRVVHIGLFVWNAYRHATGQRGIDWDEIEIPGTAAEATAWLNEGTRLLSESLRGLSDDDLRVPIEGAGITRCQDLVKVVSDTERRAAEIACLRDVYRALEAPTT
jgi:uncharacterized glyoxalase superfamily protein PhnB